MPADEESLWTSCSASLEVTLSFYRLPTTIRPRTSLYPLLKRCSASYTVRPSSLALLIGRLISVASFRSTTTSHHHLYVLSPPLLSTACSSLLTVSFHRRLHFGLCNGNHGLSFEFSFTSELVMCSVILPYHLKHCRPPSSSGSLTRLFLDYCLFLSSRSLLCLVFVIVSVVLFRFSAALSCFL